MLGVAAEPQASGEHAAGRKPSPKAVVGFLGVLAVVWVSACGGPSGRGASVTSIGLPTFHGCAVAADKPATNTVMPVRVVRPAAGGTIVTVGVCFGGMGPFTFIVDTGASATVVDATLAARLHLRTLSTSRVVSFGCTRSLSFATVTNVSVDGTRLADQVVVVGPVRSPLLPGLMGVLGSDVLGRFGAVRMDFDADNMIWAGPEREVVSSAIGDGQTDLSGPLTAGTTRVFAARTITTSLPVPRHPDDLLSSVQALVPVAVGDQPPEEFLIDTGATRTFVSPALAGQAGLGETGTENGYAGYACPVKITHYTVDSWKLEAFGLAPESVNSNALPPGLSGLLGAGTLAHYSPIVVDYRDGDLLMGPFRP